jgi:hypothetical protein
LAIEALRRVRLKIWKGETGMDGLYYGIDLGARTTIISCWQNRMSDPVTMSTVVGSDDIEIPTALAKRPGLSQWFYGREARERAGDGSAVEVPDLLENAIRDRKLTLDGRVYEARDLFAIFIRHLLELNGSAARPENIAKITFTAQRFDKEEIDLLTDLMARLPLSLDQLIVLDHREAFYYYALSQRTELYSNDVLLLEASGDQIQSCRLHRYLQTRPQQVTLSDSSYEMHLENRDMEFAEVCRKLLSEGKCSTAYLVGDGFDGGWMKESLAVLTKECHVFVGKNLYSKGGSYAGRARDGEKAWPFSYLGDQEMKFNLLIKVSDRNKARFLTLIEAGDSWFKASGQCEVILDGSPEIELWIQRPESRQAKIDLLKLEDLPRRENRTSRLRISAEAISDREVKVTILDLGFGEIHPGSGKSWVHRVRVE